MSSLYVEPLGAAFLSLLTAGQAALQTWKRLEVLPPRQHEEVLPGCAGDCVGGEASRESGFCQNPWIVAVVPLILERCARASF